MPDFVLPIGSIIAYGGEINPVWEAANGWLRCDGRYLDMTNPDYSALFAAIGYAWGGDGKAMFNVPDLEGFFLRGVDETKPEPDIPLPIPSPRDPDRDERLRIRMGGNQGDRVGTVQPFGTALPTAKGSFQLLPAGKHAHLLPFEINATRGVFDEQPNTVAWPRGNRAGADTELAPDHVHNITGGDKETRPVNAYVHWIIRYK